MAITVEAKPFGKSKTGEDIVLYTLKNEKGMEVSVMNLGAIVVNLMVPDASGKTDDVVLGFDSGEKYYTNPAFLAQ